jgi:hypothetical protein
VAEWEDAIEMKCSVSYTLLSVCEHLNFHKVILCFPVLHYCPDWGTLTFGILNQKVFLYPEEFVKPLAAYAENRL